MPLVVGAFIQFVAVGGSRWTINRFFTLSSPPVASQGVRQSGSHFPLTVRVVGCVVSILGYPSRCPPPFPPICYPFCPWYSSIDYPPCMGKRFTSFTCSNALPIGPNPHGSAAVLPSVHSRHGSTQAALKEGICFCRKLPIRLYL